ncbi:uncharacterized protein CBL_09772 [Carabus blaptoides fortunei]
MDVQEENDSCLHGNDERVNMIDFTKAVRRYWTQFLAVFTASLGPISNGMEFGWASPAVPILSNSSSQLQLTHDDSFWVETLYIIGGVCGLPVTFVLLQYLGRKKSLIASECVSVICWVLVATSSSVSQLLAARFISGMAANIIFVGLPMYTAEISEPAIRGFLGSFVYIMSIFGILLSYSVIPFMPIYASSIIGGCICLSMILTFSWQPESPYYLLLKGRKDQARAELERLRFTDNIDAELDEISKAVERQNAERGRPIDLISSPSNRKAILVMTVLNTAQNFCGMTVITMNAQSILQSSGTVSSIELSAILFGLTMFLSSVLGSVLIDKFGRKFLLISSTLLASIFLAILTGFFIAKDELGADTDGYTWIPFFATIAYAFAFKYGMGLVPIIVTAELFPTSVKSMGMVLSDMWFTVSATLSIKLYYATSISMGMYFPMTIFCCFGIFTVFFVHFYIPETKGKTLEEIQMILKGKATKEPHAPLAEYRVNSVRPRVGRHGQIAGYRGTRHTACSTTGLVPPILENYTAPLAPDLECIDNNRNAGDLHLLTTTRVYQLKTIDSDSGRGGGDLIVNCR